MKGKAKLRFLIMSLVMLGMMVALIVQLGTLTLAEGSHNAQLAESRSMKTIHSTAARGRILDRNGIPLAYDETSYNVQFSRDPENRAANSPFYTEALTKAIEIIEKGGGTLIDTFYIKLDEKGTPYYDWGVESEDAIKARYKNFCDAMGFKIPADKAEDMSAWKSAADAYTYLRETWNIPVEMPFEEAKKIMSIRQEVNLNQWRAYEPITIAYNVPMEVVAEIDMRSDELMGVSTTQSTSRVYPWGATAAHILGYLSRQVSDKVSESEMQRMGYSVEDYAAYKDIYAVDQQDNIVLNENGEKQVQMTRMGYSTNDYIGVAGVEKTMEKYLTANTSVQRGTRTVEANKSGVVMRELDRTAAMAGNDVMLTIDLPLQTVTEAALEKAILKINEKEKQLLAENYAAYQEKREDVSTIKMAQTGSIVVLDVHTGKVLAMASYPTFDPNTFIKGLTPEQAEALFQSVDGNMPTLNRAIASRLAPGSIFKMATGLAGLMEGVITPETKISDGHVHKLNAQGQIVQTSTMTEQGRYTTFMNGDVIQNIRQAPKCWVKHSSIAEHADRTLSTAITVSCNYYFFTVTDAIGINKLNEWSALLGLNSPTGIELPGELASHVGDQKALYDNTLPLGQQKSSLPGYVHKKIQEYIVGVLKYTEREATEDAIKKCATRILQLQGGYGTSQEFGDSIRKILSEELGLPINITKGHSWSHDISSYLTELAWKPVMSVRTGMGQGITLVTPVAIARYAAAFANGGTVYDVHIVDRILDENGSLIKVAEPTVFNKIDAPDAYWNAILSGLEGVVSPEDGGTAAKAFTPEFRNAGYLEKISGKSGTAQISLSDNNIDIENTSWFVTMLPRGNPEIVIITCIPYGYSGSLGSGPAIEDIVRFYIDRKEGSAKDNLVNINGLIP